jgi:hypothetical protein
MAFNLLFSFLALTLALAYGFTPHTHNQIRVPLVPLNANSNMAAAEAPFSDVCGSSTKDISMIELTSIKT